MAAAMVYEKFWSDKNLYSDAERQHYESLAKACENTPKMVYENFWIDKKMYDNAERQYYENLVKCPLKAEVVEKVVEKKQEQAPVKAAPENVHVEKTSKRRRRNKGSISLSESSNKGDPVVEAVVACPIENIPVTPVDAQPKKPKEKSKSDKSQKNKTDKVSESDDVKTGEVCDIQTNLAKGGNAQVGSECSLASEVAKARQHIKKSLECMDSVLASVPNVEVTNKLATVATEVSKLGTALNDLRSLVLSLQNEVKQLKEAQNTVQPSASSKPAGKPAPAPKAAAAPNDDSDDGVDLFASESEDDEEAARIKEERLAAYAAKKSKKPVLIAKSNIILDVKPWDDETDMAAMEKQVRTIVSDGLLWGASKLVALAYGIQKLQISCVVEDDKISVDWLQEEIEKIEELVQSCDIAAFNKV